MCVLLLLKTVDISIIFTGEGEKMEGGDGKEGSESECWKDKNHVIFGEHGSG